MRSCTRFSRASGSASARLASISARRLLMESGVRLRPRFGRLLSSAVKVVLDDPALVATRGERGLVLIGHGGLRSTFLRCHAVSVHHAQFDAQVGAYLDVSRGGTARTSSPGTVTGRGSGSSNRRRRPSCTWPDRRGAGSDHHDPGSPAQPPRAGDVLGHVERALLVQVVARAPRTAPDGGAMGARRPGRERRRGRRGRRDRRRHTDREPQPPLRHRAVPGRGDRGGWHPPRHLHDGRQAHRAHGSAALRSAGGRRGAAGSPKGWSRASRLRQRGGRADRRRGGRLRRRYEGNPLVNVLCLGLLPVDRLVLGRATGAGNLAVLLGSSTGPRRDRRRVGAGLRRLRGCRRRRGQAAQRAGR